MIYDEDQLVGPIFISSEAFEANSNQVFDMAVYIESNDDVAMTDVQIIVAVILAAAAGVIASIRPAAKAARLPILDAMATS